MPGKGKKRPANEFFDAVSAMADELSFDDEQDRGRYIHQHMTRAGYKMVPSYVDDEESGAKDDDDFFGTSSRRSRGNDRGRNDRGGNDSGGGWFPG
jgi:hypothetical protein